MGKYRILHYKEWRDNDAKFDEWWTLAVLRPAGRFRKARWVPVTYWAYDSGGGSKSRVRYFRKEDANRAAQHYGINIEEARAILQG